jgi:chromosomal replication initiator protein
MDAAVSAELDHIWKRVQAELASSVDEETYRIWLEPLRAGDLTAGRLLVEAPPQACGWIRSRFGSLLQAKASLVVGPDTVVELAGGAVSTEQSFVALGSASALAGGRQAWAQSGGRGVSRERASPARERCSEAREHGSERNPGIGHEAAGNPKLAFDQFVIGDSNRLAHAAALTVAEMPAHAYNPLFICGPPGVGKTHLLRSIANLLLSHSPSLTVRCTTGEAFTNEFLLALGGGATEGFKARFRHIDVLLLDDVQFLERKTKTEEEFFHTFNALHDAGQQIVLTSDRPPHDLQALEDRLRDRFESGLVADIKPPDLKTRLAILRKRVHDDRIELADDLALTIIADRVRTNVRALEGALIRVVAYSSLTGRPLTADLAREVLDSLYPRGTALARRNASSIGDIQLAVGEHFGVSRDELLSKARDARVAWPRQVAMYLSRELTEESLPAIGRHFGGRDHTTVLHACRRTTARMLADDAARKAIEHVSRGLDHDSR